MAGNANSGPKREKPWAEALRIELAAGGENQRSLRQIAKVVIAQAKSGDMMAIKEIADRLDGKSLQAVESHTTHEICFAEVPAKTGKDEWLKQYAGASGAPKAVHSQH